MQNLKLYVGSFVFILLGMACIFSAFKKDSKKSIMLKASMPPLPKKDSRALRIILGAILIYGGLALLFY